MDWILTIVVSVLMANTHLPRNVHEYHMVYLSRHTCEAAEEQLDKPLLRKWYEATHKSKAAVPRTAGISTSCAAPTVYDPRADSDWWNDKYHPFVNRALLTIR